MSSQVKGLRVASVIFGLMSLAQLNRVLFRLEILVSGHALPLWVSMIVCPVLAMLSFWMWKLSRQS